MSTCRACEAPIRWAITIAGRTIPLNAEPDPAGNVIFTGARRRTRTGDSHPSAASTRKTASSPRSTGTCLTTRPARTLTSSARARGPLKAAPQ